MNQMHKTLLTEEQKKELAMRAIRMRKGDDDFQVPQDSIERFLLHAVKRMQLTPCGMCSM